jgi:chromate transporter
MAQSQAPGRGPRDVVPFRTATRAWLAISLQTFGGPAGQIAVMQRMLVDEKQWIGQRRFLHALSYCTLLPGPEAQQLATYIGWLLNGVRGGLVAGGLFVLPGAVALLALSAVYVSAGDTFVIDALFAGLAAAVLAIVTQAVSRVGRRALHGAAMVALAVGAFAALTLFAIGFPLVVVLAGLAGWAYGRWASDSLHGPSYAGSGEQDETTALVRDDMPQEVTTSRRYTVVVLLVGLVAWAGPMALFAAFAGADSVFVEQGLFFSGAAVVTFGGAYAVLAYVAQRAVEVYGWLGPGEMMRGLALAETTPGPLIMVVQFVAFVGAYRDPGQLNPWVAAVLAALLVTWVTFVPSFVFVLVGAPWVERLRGNRSLIAAMAGVTAAVVGVIASLAVYFAIHTVFGDSRRITAGPLNVMVPELSSVRPTTIALATVAYLCLFGLRQSVLRTLGVCAALGLSTALLGLLVP